MFLQYIFILSMNKQIGQRRWLFIVTNLKIYTTLILTRYTYYHLHVSQETPLWKADCKITSQ